MVIFMNDNEQLNPVLAGLALLLLVLLCLFTYFVAFGRHSYTHEAKPFDGFTYTKTTQKDGSIEQAVFSAGTPGGAAPFEATHKKIDSPKDGFIYNHFETVAVVLPKNRFSPVAAVRNAHFTWDDSPYYKAHTAKMAPMARSDFDKYVEEKLMTKLDDIDFNHEIMPLMRQAQNHSGINNAAEMVKNGQYDEALKNLRDIAGTTDNLCVRSAALSHIVNIYRLTGDSVQEKRAWGALAVVNTQFYMKAFPDKVNALKSVSSIAGDAINRFKNDKPNLNFKLPNRDF